MAKFSVVSKKTSGKLTYRESVTMEQPKRLPKPGDVLRVKRSFYTPRPEAYKVGDTLEIISRTRKNPWNVWCTLGNLRVRGKDGQITVWSNIEWAIVDGTLEYT